MPAGTAGTQSAPLQFGLFDHLKSIHFPPKKTTIKISVSVDMSVDVGFNFGGTPNPMPIFLCAGDSPTNISFSAPAGVLDGVHSFDVSASLDDIPDNFSFFLALIGPRSQIVGGGGDATGTWKIKQVTTQGETGHQKITTDQFEFELPGGLDPFLPPPGEISGFFHVQGWNVNTNPSGEIEAVGWPQALSTNASAPFLGPTFWLVQPLGFLFKEKVVTVSEDFTAYDPGVVKNLP